MANGKALIFESVTVKDFGAATNVVIDNIDDENITITNEVLESLVNGGQTIQDYFNQGMEIVAYDLDILDGTTDASAYIQTNSTLATNTANITLNGASGSVDVAITNVRVSAMRPFNDLNRDHLMLKATLSSTSGITVSDA